MLLTTINNQMLMISCTNKKSTLLWLYVNANLVTLEQQNWCRCIGDTIAYKFVSKLSAIVTFGSFFWNLMHYYSSHFHPYHAVQLKSLVIQLHFVWPVVGRPMIDRRYHNVCLLWYCCMRQMFLLDIFRHFYSYCKKYTQKWVEN